ncbi:sialidase domain-containing protein [Clostridium sp.]|uniref:sialidase domain-containing protein n=1 Tax=Clostridium sp. TaxID=1506 RepID=UPI003F3E5F8A
MKSRKIMSLILSAAILSSGITYSTLAEINELENGATYTTTNSSPTVERTIPKTSITATASSFESGEDATKVIDNNLNTMWHTPWNGSAKLPQSLYLKFDKKYEVSSIRITPRQSGDNGKIQKYEIYSGEARIAEGTFDTSSNSKIIELDNPISLDNIEIRVIEAVGGYASIAEVDVYTNSKISNKVVSYENTKINNGEGGNKSEDLSKLSNLEEGTIVARFNHTSPGLQSIFSISNNNTNNGHFHIYTFDGKIGYEIRYDDGTTSRNLAIGSANAVLNTGINTIAFKVEKNIGYTMYLNGKKLVFDSSNSTKFIKDLFEVNSVNLGKTDRKAGNEYVFNGNIDFVDIYAEPISDSYLESKTAETKAEDMPLPEGSIKTDPVDVYKPGQLQSNNFRIPSMITTKDGTLLAAIDVRKGGGHDSPNNIDTAVKRSTDGGVTWDEGKIILDYPDSASGIDASMLQDKESGKIFLLVDAFPDGRGAFQSIRGSGFADVEVNGETKRGMILKNSAGADFYAVDIIQEYTISGEVKKLALVVDTAGTETDYRVDAKNNLYKVANGEASKIGNTFGRTAELKAFGTSYLALISSEDDGVTWSEPQIISGQFKKEWMSFLGTGPGNGIQIKNGVHAGRLIFPVYFLNKNQKQSSASIYSDDGGKTWIMGESVNDGRILNGNVINSSEITGASGEEMTECQIVEMPDGQLKMFMRNPSRANPAVATSFDGGETWEAIVEYETDLREPYCQLSVINYSQKVDGNDALIFSNPDSSSRTNGAVQVGLINEVGVDDKGRMQYDFEWKYKQLVKPGYFAYSSLAELPNGEIGLFYEGTDNKAMSFTKMNMEYLKADLIAQAPEAKVESVVLNNPKESYKPGDELSVKIKFDQSVSLIGNRSFIAMIGDKEVVLNKDIINSQEAVFTGVIPSDIEPRDYDITLKGKNDLEIINVIGKLSNISSDIVTGLKVNIINDTVGEEDFKLSYLGGSLNGEGINISSDIDKIKKLNKGTIVAEFDTNSLAVQSIFSVSNSNKKDGHFHIYVQGGKIGYELRYEGPNGRMNLSTGSANVSLQEGKNKIAFKAENGIGYSMFLNGEKVLTISKTDSNFLTDLFELDSVYIGKTKRATGGFEYPFTGEISYVDLYSKVLSDEELNSLTSLNTPIIADKIENLSVSEKSNDSITISWDEPNNKNGLVGYTVYKDGKEIENISAESTSYKSTGLKTNTIYGFKVVSKYSNGEISKPASINIRTSTN